MWNDSTAKEFEMHSLTQPQGPSTAERESKSGCVSFWKQWTEFKKKKKRAREKERPDCCTCFRGAFQEIGTGLTYKEKKRRRRGKEEAGDETVATPLFPPGRLSRKNAMYGTWCGVGGVMGVFEFQVWGVGRADKREKREG